MQNQVQESFVSGLELNVQNLFSLLILVLGGNAGLAFANLEYSLVDDGIILQVFVPLVKHCTWRHFVQIRVSGFEDQLSEAALKLSTAKVLFE